MDSVEDSDTKTGDIPILNLTVGYGDNLLGNLTNNGRKTIKGKRED